jgi:peptidyl-prolyl cis-trans isomerase C
MRPLIDKRMAILLLAQMLGVVAIVVYFSIQQKSGIKNSAHFLKEAATRLQGAGLTKEATKAYQLYLEQEETLSLDKKAQIAFMIGQLLEEDKEYEKALGAYYQVQALKSGTTQSEEAAKRIVVLLEKLKKYSAAKYALNQQTSLDQNVKSGAKKVASINGKNIYDYELEEGFQQMGQMYEKKFGAKEGKVHFLQKMVSDELLYKKAKKQELDRDSEVRSLLEKMEKQLLVQKILEKEITGQVRLDQEDIQNYFQAHQERYQQKASVVVDHYKVKGKKKSQTVFAQLKKKQNVVTDKDIELIKDQSLFKDQLIDGKINPPDLLFSSSVDVTNPIVSQGVYHIFKVKKRIQAVSPTFAQVEARVKMDYQMEKSQKIYMDFIQKIIKTEDVKLYVENIK